MTTPYDLGELVAERRLDDIAEDGTRTEVTVRIGTPRPDLGLKVDPEVHRFLPS